MIRNQGGLTGYQEQSGNLLVYDRLTLDERLEKYIEFEPDLLINDP